MPARLVSSCLCKLGRFGGVRVKLTLRPRGKKGHGHNHCSSVSSKKEQLTTTSTITNSPLTKQSPHPWPLILIIPLWERYQGHAHYRDGCACVCAKSLQLYITLCDPMDQSLPGSSVHGVLQTKILEWVVMPSSKGSSWPRDRTHVSYVSCIGRWEADGQLASKKVKRSAQALRARKLLQNCYLSYQDVLIGMA